MKLIRFEDDEGNIHIGEQIDRSKARLIQGDLYDSFEVTDKEASVRRLLAPVQPVNAFAIGLNYLKHAQESNLPVPDQPLVFAKVTSCIIGPGDAIVLPADAPDEVDYEAELVVVIGKKARKVSEANALKYVLGYTCGNDVSARDCQIRRDKQWTRAKGFDTFGPIGPCLVVDPKMDSTKLQIRARLNGKIMQDANTEDMIFSVPKLISYLSQHFTLMPGTVIFTGTPSGVGYARTPAVYLRPGDQITIEIDGIGELTNPVKQDE